MLVNNTEYRMDIQLKGTYFDKDTKEAFLYVGLKKDKTKQERTNYKDRFISPSIFQWESENNTTKGSRVGKLLLNTQIVHLFVRKVDEEDNVILPFTYFGTGRFENIRESSVINATNKEEYKTLLFDISLDNEVPEEYRLDFEIPNRIIN